jgi:hypothetical protein
MKTQTKLMTWSGRILQILIILFLLLDAVMKVVKAEVSVEGTLALGYPESTVVPIGIMLLIGTILYAIPKTAILGAIVLTGYLGGATASHFRMEDPIYFSIIFGILVWLALYLSDARLRELIPFKR